MFTTLPKTIKYGLQHDFLVNVCLTTGKVYTFSEQLALEDEIQSGRCIAAVLAIRDPKDKTLYQLDGYPFDLSQEIHMYSLWQAELAKDAEKN